MNRPVHIAVGVKDRALPVLSADEAEACYARLRKAGIGEALLVSTCDRMEIHAIVNDPGEAVGKLAAVLEDLLGAAGGDPHVHRSTGRDALRLLLAAAAAPDGVTAADPQVLGQFRDSHRHALQAGMVGDALQDRLHVAYRVAGHVRSETAVPERPVSIVSSAAQVARSIHGGLEKVRGLLIGNQEAGEMIAARLLKSGLEDLAVAHERRRTAVETAERLGARAVLPADLERELAIADIVILAAGSGRHAVTVADLEGALAARRRKPVFLVDAAVPPDADPGIDALDDVFLYNLDHLERIALEDRASGKDGAGPAWTLVEEAVASFSGSSAPGDESAHTLRIRATLEDARRGVLAAAPEADAFEATRLLVDHLAGRADRALGELPESGPGSRDALAEGVDTLFGRNRGRGS